MGGRLTLRLILTLNSSPARPSSRVIFANRCRSLEVFCAGGISLIGVSSGVPRVLDAADVSLDDGDVRVTTGGVGAVGGDGGVCDALALLFLVVVVEEVWAESSPDLEGFFDLRGILVVGVGACEGSKDD